MSDKTNISLEEHKKKLLEIFFNNSYDGIFITDREGKLVLANPASLSHLETSYEEIVGNKIQDIMERGYYDGSPSLECIRTGKSITGLVKTPSGIEILSTSTPILNDDGELELVVTNCRPLNCFEEYYNRKKAENNIKSNRKNKQNSSLIFESPLMKQLINKIDMIAKTDSTVMLYGKSGTGKSVIAEYIHNSSKRSGNRLIEINCAAIPENLIESELFGYEKGAFTGANTKGKIGLFEIADGSTIFLDEIGEMNISLQAKLLKVLDSGYIRKVGGTVYHKVDVRIIVATNKDLKQLVKKGEFREDLFYRLNVVPFCIPALKERKEDIIPIANKILKELLQKYSIRKTLTQKTINTFLEYSWPGNIRQLHNIIERLYITTNSTEIDIDILDDDMEFENDSVSDVGTDSSNQDKFEEKDIVSLKEYTNKVEYDYINKVIESCNGSITEASKKLGIHRTALYKKINKYSEDDN